MATRVTTELAESLVQYATTGRVTTELAESLVQYAATGRVTTEIAEVLVTFPPPVSPTMGQTFTDKLFLGSVATKPAISSVVGAPVIAGNAGDLALSDNGTLYVYDGVAWVATQDALPALADGEIFIGSTGLPPVAASITSGGGIDVTGGPGAIVLGSTAGGDLSGSVAVAEVVGLRNTPVSATAPALNEVLTYDGAQWAPAAVPAAGIDQLTGDVTAGPGSGSQAATLSTQGINTANNLGLTSLGGVAPTANQLRDVPAFRCDGAFAGSAFTLLAPTGAQDGRQVTFINTTGNALTINNIGSLSSRTMSASGGSTWVYSAADVNWYCTSNV